MLKTIETHDKVIIQKMAQLPVDIAAEVLTCYCNKDKEQCVLIEGDVESCPFADTLCMSITVDRWKEYLNE